jgi:ABC-type transport system, involved in lipoprotein release, permease component
MLISRLAYSNMKKKKGASIVLAVFILLAAAFMNIGITLITASGSFYDQKEAQTNGAQFVAVCATNSYKKAFEEFIFHDQRVAVAEKEEVIFMPNTKNNKTKSEQGAFLFNLDTKRQIAPFVPLDENKTIPKEKAIYLPYSLRNSISVGDDYILKYKNTDYSFKVAGYFETTYYSSTSDAYLKYFIPNACYNRIFSDIGRAIVLSARFKNTGKSIGEISEQFTKEFIDKTDIYNISENIIQPCVDSASMKESCMTLFNTNAAILLAFAFVICVIVIIVIYNHIAESIEESMINIGTLQAIGYTIKQIICSIAYEYILVCITGAVVGTVASYAVMPLLMSTMNVTGLLWVFHIHINVDLLCFCIILLVIGLTSLLATFRILKLPPVKALNRNVGNHHFRKNIIPLHKGIGALNTRLALKNLFGNFKSNLSFAIIVASGTFAIAITVILYLNFGHNNTAFYKMIGFELSDLQVTVTDHTDAEAFAKELKAMEEVRKTNLSDSTTIKVEDIDVQVITSDHFDAMEVLSVYKGSLPKYDNEIAITGVLSKSLGKGIGDRINVTAEGRTKAFLITGIYQTSNAGGKMSLIPYEGIKRLRPQYKMNQIDVYLKDGVNKESFKQKLRTLYKVAVNQNDSSENISSEYSGKYARAKKIADEKIAKLLSDYGAQSVSYAVMLDGVIILSGGSSSYKIKEITDIKDYLHGQLGSYADMMSGMVTVIILITFFITGGILSITIKSLLRKQRQDYGIYKAIGYTTPDLVKQLSLYFTITGMAGTLIGTAVVLLFANSILQLLFTGIGLTHMLIGINPFLLPAIDISIIVYINLLAKLKAQRVKKINAYELLTE